VIYATSVKFQLELSTFAKVEPLPAWCLLVDTALEVWVVLSSIAGGSTKEPALFLHTNVYQADVADSLVLFQNCLTLILHTAQFALPKLCPYRKLRLLNNGTRRSRAGTCRPVATVVLEGLLLRAVLEQHPTFIR
jgi:hypothetical protein